MDKHVSNLASAGEQGQTLVEYGLILTLISTAFIATIAILGINIEELYEKLAAAVAGAV